MRLKVLIVDDEPLAREGLRMLLDTDHDVETVSEARNGREAVAAIRTQRPDLVLLDVQMPRMDGFAVIEAVGPATMPAVIFITAHSQYAIRAFEISAVDYLLKPVTEERFRLAFQRALSRLRAAPVADTTQQMLSVLEAIANPRRQLTRLAIRSGERTIFLPIEEVDWIEAWQNYVRVHAGRTIHLLHVPMNTIAASLDPSTFIRIHRSHIVNAKRIKQLWSSSHGQYVVELTTGERLQSGRTYGETMRSLLTNPF
jgi:two-component system LytT family response regulator